MNDLPLHVVLLVVIGLAITGIGTLYAEPDDRRALRKLPRKLAVFLVGIGVVAAVMLLVEHTFARV